MKANEAPEKIYLQKYDNDTLACLNKWNIHEEWTVKPCNEKIATNIEYTRTDAFIEKSLKYIANHFLAPGMDNEIKDFVNYMKGE